MSKSTNDVINKYRKMVPSTTKRRKHRNKPNKIRVASASDMHNPSFRQAGVQAIDPMKVDTARHAYYTRSADGSWRTIVAPNVYPSIEAGIYEIGSDMSGWFLVPKDKVNSDEIVDVPNPSTIATLNLASKFIGGSYDNSLNSMGMINKMAMLLWGEPGTSKSVTIYRVAQLALDNNWVVINVPKDVGLVRAALEGIRAIEPDRGIVAVWEEFDEIVGNQHREAAMLQVLDGPHQVSKVMHIMTTNYIGRIPARILARTRRIPFQVEFQMPTAKERRVYFEAKLPVQVRRAGTVDVNEWVRRTKGMSIDNCAQLLVAVLGYGQTIDQVIADLQQRLKIAGKVRGEDPKFDQKNGALETRKYYADGD